MEGVAKMTQASNKVSRKKVDNGKECELLHGAGKKVVSGGVGKGKELEKFVRAEKKERKLVAAGMVIPWVDQMSDEEFEYMSGVQRDRREGDLQGREIQILAGVMNGEKEIVWGGGAMGDGEDVVGARKVNAAYSVRLQQKYPAFVEWVRSFQQNSRRGLVLTVQEKMLCELAGRDFSEEKTYPLTLSVASLTRSDKDMSGRMDNMAVRGEKDAEAMRKRVVDGIVRDASVKELLIAALLKQGVG